MTANLKRFDPAGTDGTDATATGNLTSVIKAGAGTVKYSGTYGMSRGSNMGLRAAAPGTADQANTTHATTAAAAGTGQVYASFENWPTGGNQEFVTLRTASGNCIRQLVSTAGSVIVQNQAGSTVATLGSISLNTIYRFELEATPGTTTSNGSGRARIYDDADTLVYDSGALTGNYGGGLATKTVSVLRVADPTTATTSGFAFGFTQPAIDTDTTPPTITPVTKNVSVTITAVPATATGAMIAPTVGGTASATVTAVPMTATGEMLIPDPITITEISGGGPMVATGQMLAPTVSVSGGGSVTAIPMTATGAMIAPTVTATQNATINAHAMVATGSMTTPAIAATRSATILAPAATATGLMPTPTVSATRNATIAAAAATATGSMSAPTIDATRSATITVLPMLALAAMFTPAVAATRNVNISVTPMTASGYMWSPTIYAVGPIAILGAQVAKATAVHYTQAANQIHQTATANNRITRAPNPQRNQPARRP